MTTRHKRPLKVGLYSPPIEGRMNGQSPKWNDIKALAQRAEEVGFDSVWPQTASRLVWQKVLWAPWKPPAYWQPWPHRPPVLSWVQL